MKKPIKIFFTDFYSVAPERLKEYGAFNISLLNDLPLFVDPFLLFNSDNSDYQELHQEIIKYVLFLKRQSARDLPEGLIKGWFHFPEVKQNWLGYSKVGNSGRGLGRKFAHALKLNFNSILKNFGNEDSAGTHLEKLTLVKNGVGKDQISDFTCNLIHGYLAGYTEKFAIANIDPKKLGRFSIQKYRFNYETESWVAKSFTLPKDGADYVLLTPVDILTKDENWIAYKDLVDDFSEVLNAVQNVQLRAQVNNYFLSQIPLEANQDEKRKGVEKTLEKYPGLIDYFIAAKELGGDEAKLQSAGRVSDAERRFVTNLAKLAELVNEKTAFYDTKWSSRNEALERIGYLRHVIEEQGGWRLFYVDKKAVHRENDLQIMFKLVWFASSYDSNSEVNNGRGPSDFVISYGSGDKTIVEFKLATNTHLEKNLKSQAEIYSKSARATEGPINVVLFFTSAENARVRSIISQSKIDPNSVILIDACSDNKPSGSKA